MKNKISLLKKIPLTVFAFLLTAGILNGQGVEVDHNSSSSDPHILLEETGSSDFTRIRMQNTGQDGYWNLATRSSGSDDFNIFYSPTGSGGFNLLNLDGDNRQSNFETDIKINNHLTEPILIMDVEDKNVALIRFEANAGQESFIKYFAQQGGTAIPPNLVVRAPGTTDNYMTMFSNSTTFSDNELGGSGGSGRLRVLHDSESTNPQLRLIEEEETDYVRLQFTNLGSSNRANIAATPGGTGRMEIGFNGLNILSVHGADIIGGGTTGRVGINDLSPTYALELPNNALAAVGQARAQDWDTYSDMRVKSNIKTIESAVETIKSLNPVSYRHHSSSFEDGDLTVNKNTYTENVGFLAQEVYEVMPTAVEKPADESEDLWAMSYDKIIPLLTRAIQEQQEVIETLQKEVDSLKAAKK